jgi:hypothetical protein
VDLPLLGLELLSERVFVLAAPWEKAVQVAVWLLGATLMGTAGLCAVKGEPLRLGQPLDALRAAGRVLLAHLVAYAAAVAGAGALFAAILFWGKELPPQEELGPWLLGAWCLLCVVLRVQLFPLTPAVLEDRGGPVDAARRVRQLTKGRRGAMLLLALLPLAALAGDFYFSLDFSLEGAPIPWILARRGLLALAYGFLELLPAAAYVRLREEKQGQDLATIFE